MQLVSYVSSHGYGHLTRAIALANALWRRRPDLHVIFRTSGPAWLTRAEARGPFAIEPIETDTGVVEIDALTPDEDETARRAAVFYADFDGRVAREAAWLSERGASLVVGDVPPLAFAAAARAGIPSMAVANFTWDWIYEGYAEAFARFAPEVIATIRRADALATRTLRLPLHGGFAGMSSIKDIAFIARHSKRPRAETLAALGVDSTRPVVLASFGGRGVSLPIEAIAHEQRLTILSFAETLPPGLEYVDLVAAADVVVSKPGYGMVTDCIANRTALLYTSRGRFLEYDVFAADGPRLLRCRYLPRKDMLAGQWRPAIDALLSQPIPPPPDTNGADVAADELLRIVGE